MASVNNPSKGIFDRMKKARSAKLSDRYTKARNGQLTNNTNRFTKGVSSAASWVTDPKSNFLLAAKDVPGFRRAGLHTGHQLEHMRVEQSKKLMGEINSSMNDKSWRAVNGNLHSGLSTETQRKLYDAGLLNKTARTVGDYNKLEQILSESSEETERLAATNIEAVKGRLVTMGQDPEMGKASIEAASIMGLAQHGFHNRKDLASTANSLAKEGGKGFAQTIVTQAQVLGAGSRPDLAAGYGLSYDEKKGEYIDGLTENYGLRGYQAIARLKPSDFSNSKSGLYADDDKGGSREILVNMLKQGKDTTKEQYDEARAKLKKFDAVKNDPKADDAARQQALREIGGEEQYYELQKQKTAYENFEPLQRIITQNATNFAYGGSDIQFKAQDVLRAAGINPQNAPRPSDAQIAAQQQQVMAEEAARRAAEQQKQQEQQNQQNNGGH